MFKEVKNLVLSWFISVTKLTFLTVSFSKLAEISENISLKSADYYGYALLLFGLLINILSSSLSF